MTDYFFIQNCFKCDYHHYSTVAFGIARWVAAWKKVENHWARLSSRSRWWLQDSASQPEPVLNLFYQNDPTSKEGPAQVPSSSSLNGCDLTPPTRTQTSEQQYSDLTPLFFIFWPSSFNTLLGRTRPWGRCWAAIRLSHRPESSGHAVHEEVDGLDIGGQHGRRFVFLRHTHRSQRRPCPICTSRSGNVRHGCGGG